MAKNKVHILNTPYPKVCEECERIYAGDKFTQRCLSCENNYKETILIERLANAETILELIQEDSNPDYFYKAAREHLEKYRG